MGTMCPEVVMADEANPGVEPSPTGLARVVGRQMLEASCASIASSQSSMAVLRSNGNQAAPGKPR